MSKAGWGFEGKSGSVTTNQKIEKKNQAFWQIANQNVIIVPDIDA